MVTHQILVTGGAGFIGSHLVDALVEKGHQVIILDNLDPQVHQGRTNPPAYLAPEATFIKGDILTPSDILPILQDTEIVYHLAARVGVAQSMYHIHPFTETNAGGTAQLFDLIINKETAVSKIITASSMSIYGEGLYRCPTHGDVEPPIRQRPPSASTDWRLRCPHCGKPVQPIPTPETKTTDCSTVYAMTKQYQEDLTLMMGKTYGIDTTALRFFGTYGPRQALSNPYTGVCAIFATSILQNNPPLVYEDGLQSRDLIYVKDIVQGLLLALENPAARHESFNVGTGQAHSILEVANLLIEKLNPSLQPQITHQFRAGDVRHITADVSKISTKLGFQPQYSLNAGIDELLDWINREKDQMNITDRSKEANRELERKKLI